MQLVQDHLPVHCADSEQPREQQQPSEERHRMDAQAEGQGRALSGMPAVWGVGQAGKAGHGIGARLSGK
eukprot:scaffold229835_cov18-Tisochrysis_lutea.AAC.1